MFTDHNNEAVRHLYFREIDWQCLIFDSYFNETGLLMVTVCKNVEHQECRPLHILFLSSKKSFGFSIVLGEGRGI